MTWLHIPFSLILACFFFGSGQAIVRAAPYLSSALPSHRHRTTFSQTFVQAAEIETLLHAGVSLCTIIGGSLRGEGVADLFIVCLTCYLLASTL